MSKALRLAVLISIALSGVLLFLLATASANTPLLEKHYPLLLYVNLAIVAVMLVFIVASVREVVGRIKARVFGTRLMAKLAISFAILGILPGVLVYLVSVQFLARSIDSWFNVRVDTALASGLDLSRGTLETMLHELTDKALAMAQTIGPEPEGRVRVALNRAREELGVEEVTVFTASGRLLASSASRYAQLVPDLPSGKTLSNLRITRQYAAIESADGDGEALNGLRLRAIVELLPAGEPGEEIRFLQIYQPVAESIARHAEAVRLGYRDYQELSLSRQGLRRIFSVTLTLTLLLALFAAISAAFLLSGWLVRPLRKLEQATKQVAGGDYRPLQGADSRDELGALMHSFNAMTRQLADARTHLEAQRLQLERQNAFFERVLAHLSAGVMVFDAHLNLKAFNAGAERILGVGLIVGEPLERQPSLAAIAEGLRTDYSGLSAITRDAWQRELKLSRSIEPREITVLARGSLLPESASEETFSGRLLVLDDISDVLAAQRALAWAEVARRLAHEIKNPLTPIQLSAERLERRLQDRLTREDAEVLTRSTTTIVNEVNSLKRMVDEFRDYARMPTAQLQAVDLNRLIQDVLTLYPPSDERARIDLDLDQQVPKILGDAAQLMQVVHNLIQNAQDAIGAKPSKGIRLLTRSVKDEKSCTVGVRFVVADDGPGFAADVLPRAFEPYVTTKTKGTGLGLAIVKKIVEEHGAKISASNRGGNGQALGADVSVTFAKLATSDENHVI